MKHFVKCSCKQYLQGMAEVVLRCFVGSISAALSGPGLSLRGERGLVSSDNRTQLFQSYFFPVSFQPLIKDKGLTF